MSATRLAMLAAAGLLATSAPAAVLFSDNFEAATPTTGTWSGAYVSSATIKYERAADAGTWFSPANTMLSVLDTDGSLNISRDARFPTGTSSSYGTFSFKFYEPAGSSGTNSPWIRFTPVAGTTAMKSLEMYDGNVTGPQVTPPVAGAEYTLGVAHQFDIMFNTTASPLTLGSYTVPALAMHVYINGELKARTPATGQDLVNSPVTAWRINTSTTGINAEYALDNVLVTDTFAVVPEPTILAGLGLAGAVGLLRRRSR